MTSRLRRKPPTTARSILTTTTDRPNGAPRRALRFGRTVASLTILLAAAAVTALPDGVRSARADDGPVQTAVFADGAGHDQGRVETVSYSTGASGSTLKWLPVRPSAADARRGPTERRADRRAERRAQYAPLGSDQGVRYAGGPDPFADPFGDKQQITQLEPPSGLLDDPELGPSGPSIDDRSLPMLDAEMRALEGESGEESRHIERGELEESLTRGPAPSPDECPQPDDFRSLDDIRIDITPDGERLPSECPLGDQHYEPRAWCPTTFTWKASGLCSKPVYFEDVHLERYGHSWGPLFQPALSAAHFFLNVPVLPYAMGVCPPNECVYTLGYYRPGNCAPFLLDPLPLSVRAGLFEAGAWTGAVFALP